MKRLKTQMRFAVCIQHDGSEDLQVGKIYQVLADDSAARDGYVRVIDDSGEDYLYPSEYFVPIALPAKAERALLSAFSSVSAA